MNTVRLNRRSALALAGFAWLGGRTVGEAQGQSARPPEGAAAEPRQLPGDSTTHYSLDLPDRRLQFSATAGAIRIPDDKGAPLADMAFIAYQLDGAERRSRDVTFVFNGGPGFASGWLHVGAVGPWRIPIGGDATAPASPIDSTVFLLYEKFAPTSHLKPSFVLSKGVTFKSSSKPLLDIFPEFTTALVKPVVGEILIGIV